ncbi:MAG: AAA family ATPase [Candidatus Fermentibacteraceae bacterium]|nr:AAA family ATPase [Candidatus Fermentibacteraceae bacterium]
MSLDTEASGSNYWLVGAVIDGVDQVERFVREGIWENGYADRYLDKVKSMLPGDRIAIKATYVLKKGLPFDNHGNSVSAMSIKAVGTVTANASDGRHISVDWKLLSTPKVWYFYTHRATVWKVTFGNWAADALLRFVFSDQPQDYGRFINNPFWYDRFGDFDGKTVYRFGWVRFYATVADNLLAYRHDRSRLIAWMHRMASGVDGIFHLKDKSADGSVFPLKDIDPFSAMGTFNRGISSEKRRIIADKFKSFLDVWEEVPAGFSGIPILDNRNSLFFRNEKDRGPGDIDALWDVFYEAILLADGGEGYDPAGFIKAYDRAAALPGVGWNLTIGLFWIRPWKFTPLDTNSREYIADVLGIPVTTSGSKGRCTAREYLHINDAVAEKLLDENSPVHSIPVLSTVAGGWEAESDVSVLVASRIDSFKALVRRSFPGFSGVADSSFHAEEIDYKRKAASEIAEMLSESVFSKMIAAGEYSELIKILRSAGSKANFLYLGTPSKGDLAPLFSDYPDEAGLCSAFYDLIWDTDESFVRLSSFYEFVAGADLPVKWATATYFLFFLHPSTEMFVKPDMMKWLLGFFRMPMEYESRPSGILYREILALCRELATQLSSWGVADMIDVHSLIWAAYKAPDKDIEVSEPEEVYELNSESLFAERTFELLSMLHDDPTKEFYGRYKDEFREFLRDPMKRLFAEIASSLPAEFCEYLETEKKLFSRIPKNDWGKGGAWDYYWGAFYAKNEKRVSSEQLYLTVDRLGIRFGYSQGKYTNNKGVWLRELLASGSPVVKQIEESLSSVPGLRYSAPESSETGTLLTESSGYASFSDWVENIDTALLTASVSMSAEEVLSLSSTELKERVASVFAALFPLMLRDTVAISALFVSVDDEEELQANPVLSLDEIHSLTGYNRKWIGKAVAAVTLKKQAVLYGPPGTGKTYLAKMIASHLIGGGFGFREIVQFHPSYSYEDFIEGLRPVASSDGVLEYRMIDGRFKEFCDRARNVDGRCVLIVDEINRANLSRVFGELMYLLEYRNEKIPLAGGSLFSIPSNVYIIGTMNTADRSIALVDHALRRRFAFIHMKPDYSVLGHYHSRVGTGFDPAGLVAVLLRVNKAIEDRNYFVGVSFFLHDDIEERIENVWRLEIEPYLEEYFFDRPDTAELFAWSVVCKEITGRE